MRLPQRHALFAVVGAIVGAGIAAMAVDWRWWWAGMLCGAAGASALFVGGRWLIAGLMSASYRP